MLISPAWRSVLFAFTIQKTGFWSGIRAETLHSRAFSLTYGHERFVKCTPGKIMLQGHLSTWPAIGK